MSKTFGRYLFDEISRVYSVTRTKLRREMSLFVTAKGLMRVQREEEEEKKKETRIQREVDSPVQFKRLESVGISGRKLRKKGRRSDAARW